MGGTSTTSNSSTQQSQLTPWAPAQGGIQNVLGTVTVNSSLVNGNTALNGGGISSGPGNGGAPPPNTSHLTVNNSQVNGNTALAQMPCYEVELQPSIETTAFFG